MSTRTQVRNSRLSYLGTSLVVLSLLFGGVAGCAQMGTQPVDLATPTPPPLPSPTTPIEAAVPSGWVTYANQSCGFDISHPSDMEVIGQGPYSWILRTAVPHPDEAARNFIYVSVIPKALEMGGDENIYNYDPGEAVNLLNLQIGESRSIHGDPSSAQGWIYTRLPDTMIDNHSAQTYENAQPWEFPAGTREIRYYLLEDDCTYLIGGYMDTAGSTLPGTITKELFDQIIATFRVIP
jgi:hypothetical protein